MMEGRTNWSVAGHSVAPLASVAAEIEARGGGDAVPSLTTSNEEIGRKRGQPEGLRPRRLARFVAPPQRCPASPRRRFARSSPLARNGATELPATLHYSP